MENLIRSAYETFRPPPKLTLSKWADEYAHLSAESAAEPGKWKTLPYQVGIMDAISDPRVHRVTMIKSARVGYTKIINHCIGYHIHYDPCPIMVVQPTEADAEGYSKEEIAPMIRDTPVLTGLVADVKSRDSGNTILQKQFPGGTLSLVGANSPRGFRRVSRRIVIFDEVDGYPPSAGAEGDQIKLGIKRSEYYWNRKIIAGSTPTTETLSRIAPMFEESDKRRLHLPCPHCGAFQYLKFPNLRWPKDDPDRAHFVCETCRKPIDHREKKAMMEAGKWIAEAEFKGHAGFHLWAAYSYSPNATWADIAKEHIEAVKGGPEELKTFVNTALGETWKEKGEAPEWKRLYDRREKYARNTIPRGAVFLTAGADVQKDRIELEIAGWGRDKQSWSMDYRVFEGDTALDAEDEESPWREMDKVLMESWPVGNGLFLPIRRMAVDANYNTQHVYNWARRHPRSRVMVVRGSDSAAVPLSQPSAVDVTAGGKRVRRGMKSWTVGVSMLKHRLYSLLKLESPVDGKPFPHGYCHFPEYDDEYFKQLTAETLVTRVVKGRKKYEWVNTRRNEALDCRVYNMAAAIAEGLDRLTPEDWDILCAELGSHAPVDASQPSPQQQTQTASTSRRRRRESSGFWNR
jgi:phage terminase large subunit GpA-like protein